MKKILIMTVLLVAGLIIIDNQHSSIINLQQQISQQKEVINQMNLDSHLAVKLAQTKNWYVVDNRTVSSEPQGSGEVVKLDQDMLTQPLRDSFGGIVGIKHPTDKGRKVVFSPAASAMIAYPVAGGILTYNYL